MPAIVDPLTQARKAFAEGDYALAAQLTRGLTADVSASALHVRSLANLNSSQAELACADFLRAHPLSSKLHYLHAVLHLDLGQVEAAGAALRRVIYLDRSLAIAHFTLGSLLERQGDIAGARRAYRNARDLCATRPAEEILPLAEGGRAGRLFETASVQLGILDSIQEGAS
jgi:chemotaxis protein methyltransferase CheR